MDSSSTDAANLLLLANLCADQSAAGENSVNNAPVASTVIECSMLSIRPKGGSIYSGVNRLVILFFIFHLAASEKTVVAVVFWTNLMTLLTLNF